MYSNKILTLFANPKNAGRISKPDGIADCYNDDDTAHIEFSLRVDSGIVMDCKFRAQASPYIVAVCSTITEMVKGRMVNMLLINAISVKEELEDDSSTNIQFCIDCLNMAVIDYREKLEKPKKDKE